MAMSAEKAEAAYARFVELTEEYGKMIAETVPNLIDYYSEQQSIFSKQQEDLLHEIEFAPMSNIALVRIARKLKECRVRRRTAKNNTYYLVAVSHATLETLLKTHKETLEYQASAKYEPRYKESEN